MTTINYREEHTRYSIIDQENGSEHDHLNKKEVLEIMERWKEEIFWSIS